MGRANTTFDGMVRFSVRMAEEEHWIPDAVVSKLVKDPNDRGGKSVGLTTAIYATYVGEVPPQLTPKSMCGEKSCVRPKHLTLVSSDGRREYPVDMRLTANIYRQICNFWVEPT